MTIKARNINEMSGSSYLLCMLAGSAGHALVEAIFDDQVHHGRVSRVAPCVHSREAKMSCLGIMTACAGVDL